MVLFPGPLQDTLARVSPSGCSGRQRWVSCDSLSLSPHGTTDPRRSLGMVGQERDPCFLVDEDLERVIALAGGFAGEEARLEPSGGAPISPGVPWLPEAQLCSWPCPVLAPGSVPQLRVPLCQIPHEKEQKPCRNAGGGAAPSHPGQQPGAAVASPAPERGQGSPKAEFCRTSVPRRASPARSSRRAAKPSSPGKEHGPASGDGQNLSLSSTLSPGAAPKAAGVWGSCCPSRGPRPAPRGSGQSRECASGSLKG